MKFKVLAFLLPLLFGTVSLPAVASYVKGHIDSPSSDYENFKIRGWACQTGRNVSINTHIYLNGQAGSGSIYRSLMASNNSEQGVANACSNSLKKNRFSLTVPLVDVYKHRNKSIYIHGISSIGSGNKLLTNSGKYKFPNVPTSKVVGHIDSFTKSGNDYYVRGWACQKYYKKSISVHVYAGGKAGGGGSHIASGKADLSSGSSIANACGTSASAYKFNVKIPSSSITNHPWAALYVHGISLVNTGNSSLGNSGNFKIPGGAANIIYRYDALGRLVEVRDSINSNLTYEYDAAGNRKQVVQK